MNYLFALAFLVFSLNGFSQTNKQNWEKALYAVTHQNETIVKTVVEFTNVPLNKTQIIEMTAGFDSKEQFVDYTISEGKTLIIYHYQSLDDSSLKTFIVPTRSDFNIVESKLLTVEEISAIFTTL